MMYKKNTKFGALKSLVVAGSIGACSVGVSQGAILISLAETGGNVVATLSGSANTAGLPTATVNSDSNTILLAASGFIEVGATNVNLNYYGNVLTGPASFGPGGFFNSNSVSGDHVTVQASDFRLPGGYVSGTTLSGSATWTGHTFATLGLTTGDYVFTWGTGVNADSVTVSVASTPTAVPEPTGAMLASLGLGVFAFRRQRKTR